MIGKILYSYWSMLVLLTLLGVGAAVATFIENDFGSSTARVLVYNHWWYEAVLILTTINLIGIIYKRKMWKQLPKFIFHFSFVVILIGAGVTRYFGYEGIMHIRNGETTNKMISLEPYLQIAVKYKDKVYYKEFQKELSAIGWNDFDYDLEFEDKRLSVSFLSYKFAKQGQNTMGLLGVVANMDGEKKETKLVGQRAVKGVSRTLEFKNGISVHLEYGSKNLKVPFFIKLREFQLERYPGSISPSSFASEVTLIDKQNNINKDYRIYMNTTLEYGGFKFFQSSYDTDEKGTVLSVNNDPGTVPTYIGYFLLALGLLLNLFDKNSRFMKLTRYIKQSSLVFVVGVLFAFNATSLEANEYTQYIQKYKDTSKNIADRFGKLVVQSHNGRMKPLDTLNMEIINKLSRKSELYGMNPNQVVLGMLTNPTLWQHIPLIKVKTPKLKKFLGVANNVNLISFSELFGNKEINLKEQINKASSIDPKKRGTFERDLLRLNERLNIAYMVFYGDLFTIFPIYDAKEQSFDKKKWHNPANAIKISKGKNTQELGDMTRGFFNSVFELKFNQASKYIEQISNYQEKYGKDIIPSKSQISSEILFNKLQVFPKLTLAYIVVGLILFILAFLTVFNEKLSSKKINNLFFFTLLTLFLAQTLTMGLRWYISGHAPWSDTYESLIYISWSIVFAGVIFFRKSLLALAATVVMSAIFMFTAHLSGIDPQITNLVPVLKSYWLVIHVSIITGSYGFLALGAMLGLMSLMLFIFRGPKRPNLDKTIKHITAINEASLIIGLSALVVGNFLGGVWANESWGRYWGWDPKETWAYVAIVAYVAVLHLRLIPKLNTPFVFSLSSTLTFSTILMTYFGVNFYLSGMHSYATGDPVPIPTWVYILTAMLFVIISLASLKRDLGKIKVA